MSDLKNEYIIDCPCCNNKIKIKVGSCGDTASFLVEEKSDISQSKLFDEYKIELGILDESR